ncbi:MULTISPECIES: serine/threonine protein kinase [Herpetosiphon]|uniref:serine/threonine protein kinase n=1 Tax=Herpetosiphon TaxID=64 RepID=UPI000D7C9925|nr:MULTISPECIES: protein kinase [Herpetosiphon]MBM7842770.1 serine/threonine protein kinase [Herpetosiphon giganteus]
MKQVCLLCERTSFDNNLYCQEVYCQAEKSPTILGYGKWLGDIEIVRPVVVLRSSVLYEASHQKERVFLKVAHVGSENTERLKREAEFLKTIRVSNERNTFLPNWRPPYANATVSAQTEAYGRAMLGEHLFYYYLSDFFAGESLRDALTKNPQMWVNHIGWLVMRLSSSIALLQSKGVLHFGINPESLLVHFEDNPSVPTIHLLDLGIASTPQNINNDWYSFMVPPAYTAPEIMQPHLQKPSYATDVYGLGLILYEMLVGVPAYPFKLKSDEEVYQAVLKNHHVNMNRTADVRAIAELAVRMVDVQVANRPQNAAQVVQELLKLFGEVPTAKKSRWPSLNTILIIVISLLTVAFLITFFVTLNQLNII